MTIFRTKAEITEEEISWYLLFSEADCGFRSNWNAVINGGVFGGGVWEDTYNDHIFQAVRQRRTIANRLMKLSDHHRNILYTSFGNEQIPSMVSKYFQRYSAAALHNKLISPDELIRICNQFYMNQASDEQKLQLLNIKNVAITDYTAAIEQYYLQRKKK